MIDEKRMVRDSGSTGSIEGCWEKTDENRMVSGSRNTGSIEGCWDETEVMIDLCSPENQKDETHKSSEYFTKRENLTWLAKIFENAQNSFTHHISHSNAVLKRFSDCLTLFQHLEPFIRLILVQEKDSPSVSRSVKFLVKIATCVSNGKKFSDSLVEIMLQYCMKYWNSKNRHVRLQICNLTGTLLNELDEEQEIDDEVWMMLQKRLLFRLKDKIPQVRKSAAIALNRLQDAQLRMECPIQQGLIELMDHDKNKVVRLEALKRIDLNADSLLEVYRRLRDRDAQIRAFAYQRLRKVAFDALSVKDRVNAINTGLRDRNAKVREICSSLVIESWFSGVNGDVLKFLHMMDPEQYESECELIVKHILSSHAEIQCEQPPYRLEELNVESVLYWRILVEFLKGRNDNEGLDRVLPTLSEYTELLQAVKLQEFIAWQLLKMADYLEWFDEFGRASLTEELLSMMKDKSLSNELIPFVAKVLRRCIPNEDEFIRQVIETVINEIRDPIGEQESEEVLMKKKVLADKLQSVYELRDVARKKKRDAVADERFDDAKIAKKSMEDFSTHIVILEEEMQKLQRGDQDTWKRILAIIADLLEYTKKPVTHAFLQPLLDTTLNNAIGHKDPEIREPGLLAFGLYCLLDKETARSYMPLFASVLQHDQLAMKYLALKIVFDIFMVFNFMEAIGSDGEAQYSDRMTDLLEIQKGFLTHPDQDLLGCAVEGFCKLLFLNRLPRLHLDVLCHLILLFFNIRTEENEHIRQTLAMFFPYYVNLKNKDSKYGNRELVAACLMPCLRTVAYASVDSPFCNVNITNFAEFLLSLLTDDSIKLKAFKESGKSSVDIFQVHQDVAFDVLFEIEANMGNEDILPFCRVLAILTIDPNNQQNVKKYKILVDRIMKKVRKRNCLQYLSRFRGMLHIADKNPDESLSYGLLMELQDRRDRAVMKAKNEYKEYKDTQRSEDEEVEVRLLRKPRKKRKKLHGCRRPMDTSEDLQKPRKKKRIISPERIVQAAKQTFSEKKTGVTATAKQTGTGSTPNSCSKEQMIQERNLQSKVKVTEKVVKVKSEVTKVKREVTKVKKEVKVKTEKKPTPSSKGKRLPRRRKNSRRGSGRRKKAEKPKAPIEKEEGIN